MARVYLRASPARSLEIEVDYVAGREPANSALTHLKAVLDRETDKAGGITFRPGNQITQTKETYTLDDLVALERVNRSRYSGSGTATMWIAYLNGSFADSPGALGVTFRASASVIFRDRLNDATSALISEPAIERAVVLHEAGHLLALVNLGYTYGVNQEDAKHPHHSRNVNSVMYWAVEDVSVRNIIRGGPPSDFDADDREDLAYLRTG